MIGVLAIAAKEFRDDLRSRWTIAIALLFAGLALAIAYFGGAAAGRTGFIPFETTLASLTTLAAFVVPLIGLLLAYDTLAGERQQGTLLLILSYPVTRAQVLTGKFYGHSGALAVATVAGFGLAVLIIEWLQPQARTLGAWLHLGNFVLSAALLGACFVTLASVISVLAGDKARAAGLALIAWLATVIIFDLVLLAALVASRGSAWQRTLFPQLLYLNPIDVFRLINLSSLGAGSGNELFLGMTGAHAYSQWTLYLALIAWIVIPLGLAQWLFRSQET